MATKKLKPGINPPIICKKCGHRVGTVRLKSKIRWRYIRYAIGLGLLFEIIANAIVYLIFKKL